MDASAAVQPAETKQSLIWFETTLSGTVEKQYSIDPTSPQSAVLDR